MLIIDNFHFVEAILPLLEMYCEHNLFIDNGMPQFTDAKLQVLAWLTLFFLFEFLLISKLWLRGKRLLRVCSNGIRMFRFSSIDFFSKKLKVMKMTVAILIE